MLVSVFIVCFLLLYLNFLCESDGSHSRFREPLVSASVVQGACLVIITELLSWFHVFATVPVAMAWAVVDAALLLRLAHRLRGHPLTINTPRFTSLPPLERGLLFMTVFILGITFLTALMSPPNNWDSMLYHMARVAHWIQNRSVDFYPTATSGQNAGMPGSEFAILHLQVLAGGDYLANMVQWHSLATGVVVVSLIAAELGGNLLAQLLAALVAATVPMAIAQSTSTQTDLVVSFWSLSSGYYLMRLVRHTCPRNATLVGLSMGLALLTKATSLIFLPPLVAVFLGMIIKTSFPRWRETIRPFCIIALACLALNGAFWFRNNALYGDPLGPYRGSACNNRMTPAIYASNALRNLTLHMGTPSEWVNAHVWMSVKRTLGPQSENPDSTLGSSRFSFPYFTTHEDLTGNTLHLLVGTIFLFPVFWWAIRRKGLVLAYVVAVLCGCLVYPYLLRWQPWATRLHLPMFMLSAPILGCAMVEFLSRRWASVLAVVFFLCSFPWLFFNETRPVLGPASIFRVDRVTSSFANRPDYKAPYLSATDWIVTHHTTSVGLMLTDWEYPLWALIQARQGPLPRMEHVNVHDASGILRDKTFVPDVIVADKKLDSFVLDGTTYKRVFMWKPLVILERDTTAKPAGE